MIQLSVCLLTVTRDTVGTHRRCCRNCVPQTNQPVARQQVNNQGLLSKCRSYHTASTDSRPKTPGIMSSMDQKCSYVGVELRNKRGVLVLRYPLCTVQPRTGRRWERSRLPDRPRQRCGSRRRISYYSNCESRQTAFDAAETGEFQSVARSVVETKVCYRRPSKHRVLDRSADPHRRIHQRRDAVFHTDLTRDSTDADCTVRSVTSRGVRRVATESRPKRKCHVSFENTAATAATTAVQCHVQADGLSLRGRPTPSPQGVGRRGVRADTTTTAHVRQQPPVQPRSWRSDVRIILPTGGFRSIPTVHPCGLRSGGCG